MGVKFVYWFKKPLSPYTHVENDDRALGVTVGWGRDMQRDIMSFK